MHRQFVSCGPEHCRYLRIHLLGDLPAQIRPHTYEVRVAVLFRRLPVGRYGHHRRRRERGRGCVWRRSFAAHIYRARNIGQPLEFPDIRIHTYQHTRIYIPSYAGNNDTTKVRITIAEAKWCFQVINTSGPRRRPHERTAADHTRSPLPARPAQWTERAP